MRYLDAEEIQALVPLGEMIDAVDGAYRDVAAGRDRSPIRSHVAFEGGDLLLMPGVADGAAGVSVKLVTIVPRNAHRALPTVQAVIAWIDAQTGTPLALLDGTVVTAMRTGAGTGAATRLLARPDAHVLAMIGAGAQAEWQVRAVCAVRPIEEVRIWAPSERRHELATRLGALVDATVRAVDSSEDAIRAADVVACATTSETPVFEARWLAPGAHVNGVGAFRPGMVELPADLFGRADTVAVDSRTAAFAEAGDLLAAIEQGRVSADAVIEIGTVSADRARDPEAITVFKSVGLAAQDAAAVELIARRAGLDAGFPSRGGG